MIVVLEGVNGAGKTALAQGLRQQLDWPVYRPFRPTDEFRWDSYEGSVLQRELFQLDIRPNTHVEDLHFADAAAQCKFDAILDRSALSAVVYGEESGDPVCARAGEQIIDIWGSAMMQAGAITVLLEISWEGARERLNGDRLLSREKHDRMQERFAELANRTPMPLYQIDVEEHSLPPEILANQVSGIVSKYA